MKNKILPFSLIFFLLALNIQNILDPNSMFYGVAYVLQLIALFLIVSFGGGEKCSYLKSFVSSRESKLLSLFTVLILVAIPRSSVLDVISSESIVFDLSFVLLIYLYVIKVCTSMKTAIDYLFFGIFFFLLLNVVLLLVGVENPSSRNIVPGEASILNSIGYEFDRVLYPLYSGAGRNNIGILAGCLFCYVLALLPSYKNKKKLLLVSVVPLWIFITADTRGSLLACVLSLGLYYLIRRHSMRSMRFLPFALPLFPLIVLALSYLAFDAGVAATISREGSADLASGRSLIWLTSFNELLDFKLVHFFGFGSFGQAISGVSYDYIGLFKSWPNENLELISLHNAAIQMIFDIGYLGLILYIYLMFRLLTISIDSIDIDVHALSPVLIFITLSGITEVTPLLYTKDMFFVFFMLAAYLSVRKNVSTEYVVT